MRKTAMLMLAALAGFTAVPTGPAQAGKHCAASFYATIADRSPTNVNHAGFLVAGVVTLDIPSHCGPATAVGRLTTEVRGFLRFSAVANCQSGTCYGPNNTSRYGRPGGGALVKSDIATITTTTTSRSSQSFQWVCQDMKPGRWQITVWISGDDDDPNDDGDDATNYGSGSVNHRVFTVDAYQGR